MPWPCAMNNFSIFSKIKILSTFGLTFLSLAGRMKPRISKTADICKLHLSTQCSSLDLVVLSVKGHFLCSFPHILRRTPLLPRLDRVKAVQCSVASTPSSRSTPRTSLSPRGRMTNSETNFPALNQEPVCIETPVAACAPTTSAFRKTCHMENATIQKREAEAEDFPENLNGNLHGKLNLQRKK